MILMSLSLLWMSAAAPAQPPSPAARLASLSEARRGEVRCAMLAGLVVSEAERDAPGKDYGLTGEQAETLAGRLAETIMFETGWSQEDVRALYRQDFEDFAAASLASDPPAEDPATALDRAIGACRPLYDSMDLSGEGDGQVGGLSPAAFEVEPGMDNILACHALLSSFVAGMPEGSKEAAAFGKMVTALRDRHAARAPAGTDVDAELAQAAVRFDGERFDALPEQEGETRMLYCFDLAGQPQ